MTNPIGALDNSYTNITSVNTADGGNLAKAQELGATISQFYNDAFAGDVQATLNDKAAGYDVPENDDKVAADIATLHNLDVQFAEATGDSTNVARLDAHPDQLLGTTSNKLLSAAGVNHTDQDFEYSATALSGGSQVDAHLIGDTDGNQGTAAYQYAASSVVVTNSALGTTGEDWGLDNGSTNLSGGRYDAGDGLRATQNLLNGDNLGAYTPRQLADVYAYMTQMSPSERSVAMSTNQAFDMIWNMAASSTTGDPTTNTDAFNAVYDTFQNNMSSI